MCMNISSSHKNLNQKDRNDSDLTIIDHKRVRRNIELRVNLNKLYITHNIRFAILEYHVYENEFMQTCYRYYLNELTRHMWA